MPTLYKPKVASNAISRAMRLSDGEALCSLTMLRSADRESDRTLARTFVPGSHSRIATKIAKASQSVLKLESPMVARKRLSSAVGRGVAYQAMGT